MSLVLVILFITTVSNTCAIPSYAAGSQTVLLRATRTAGGRVPAPRSWATCAIGTASPTKVTPILNTRLRDHPAFYIRAARPSAPRACWVYDPIAYAGWSTSISCPRTEPNRTKITGILCHPVPLRAAKKWKQWSWLRCKLATLQRYRCAVHRSWFATEWLSRPDGDRAGAP